MGWDRRSWTALAALSGLISVAAGAFAAHGLSDPAAREWMRAGATWQAIHALAVLAASALTVTGAPRARWASAFFLAGSALFSGSLYATALGAPRWLGVVTPLGGLLFLAGWVVLAWASLSLPAEPREGG